MMLQLSPTTFQALALAWVGSLIAIAGAALAGIKLLMPQINELRDLWSRHDERLTSVEQKQAEQEPIVQMVRRQAVIEPAHFDSGDTA